MQTYIIPTEITDNLAHDYLMNLSTGRPGPHWVNLDKWCIRLYFNGEKPDSGHWVPISDLYSADATKLSGFPKFATHATLMDEWDEMRSAYRDAYYPDQPGYDIPVGEYDDLIDWACDHEPRWDTIVNNFIVTHFQRDLETLKKLGKPFIDWIDD